MLDNINPGGLYAGRVKLLGRCLLFCSPNRPAASNLLPTSVLCMSPMSFCETCTHDIFAPPSTYEEHAAGMHLRLRRLRGRHRWERKTFQTHCTATQGAAPSCCGCAHLCSRFVLPAAVFCSTFSTWTAGQSYRTGNARGPSPAPALSLVLYFKHDLQSLCACNAVAADPLDDVC